jgi:hypothetical protein
MAGAPNTKQLSYGAVAAGIGGIVLIIALFLPWVDNGFASASYFDIADITDIILLLIGAAAVAFAAMEFTGGRVNLPFSLARALQVIGIIATTLVWANILEGTTSDIGAILGGLAAIAILVGGYLAEKRPGLSMALGGGQGGYAGGGAPQAGPGGYAPPPQGGGYGPPPGQAGGGGYAAAPAPQATSVQPIAPPGGGTPPPPGGTPDWYPDPRGEKRLRYYDGNGWTEHVAD